MQITAINWLSEIALLSRTPLKCNWQVNKSGLEGSFNNLIFDWWSFRGGRMTEILEFECELLLADQML